MKKFLITVNGSQYEVDVEEVTGMSGVSAAPQAIQPHAVFPSEPVEKAPSVQPEKPKPAALTQAPAPVTVPAPTTAPAAATAGSQIIRCPMPGTILKVSVAIGETVKKNQVLCVLEAMKMENDIVSPRDSVVTGVMITKGASVNAGDPLVSLK